ncbi:NAD(P)-binding domain-containing protein [Streptomyces sp. H10-C2]|uniref:NADPH-dependent F420 reductase n=1 Tax=unclassified Streptomyces TaxID=2593676 RepID=UPI0024BB0729|nr:MULTISPECIES: NAD(P)-binding domain-containing protein [unclassified Streptomyces]MDJ0343630.1 NAD(P)-binding domain-containing protein [Streptomyces sp. PH10-H1]MDJ0373122.1 NAD(P)-binding domain-containing protein [Streptomyces sp. H10-C2]
MRIGILGAGNMADALGTQWARAGHELTVSGRHPDRAAALAKQIGPAARAGSWAEAAVFGDVVLLAVRDQAVPAVLEAAGAAAGALRGRVLIDCTNPVVPGRFTLATQGGSSMAERVAETAVGAHVVKAFNLCHEDVWRMTPPVFDGSPLAVPLCGDDADALATARSLVRDLGCEPVEGGGLERAGLLEATAAFMIGLWVCGADAQAVIPPLKFAFGAR